MAPLELSGGRPEPLGATFDGSGVNFALFSANADKVELCLFDHDGEREIARMALAEHTDDVWHGYLPGARPGPALRLSCSWALRSLERPPLQPEQASHRSLRSRARPLIRMERPALRLYRRRSARRPFLRYAR